MSEAPGAASSATTPDVVVVGGGVAGLVVALDVARAGRRVVVLEASDRLGGCVAPVEVDGLVLDAGAESFATRSPAVPDLLADVGLADDVVLPAPLAAWLQLPDGPLPLPRTGVLGVPGDPWAADVRQAIGLVGSLRASLDRVLPASAGLGGRGTSLGALVRRRQGRRVLERLVAPIVGGVHSAHPDDVDLDVVLPNLRAQLERHGSLAAAVSAVRAAAPAGSAVGGIAGGMHRLVGALADAVRAHGGEIRTGVRVTAVEAAAGPAPRDRPDGRTGDVPESEARWRVTPADGASLAARDVVVAVPGPAALALLRDVAPATGLEAAADTGVVLVSLVLDPSTAPTLASAPRGTGVLAARGVPGVRAKALTHATAKWPWLRERAGGREVVRLSYGLAGAAAAPAASPATLPTGDALRDLATRDAAALLGVPLTPDVVRGWARTDWPAGLPHARPGHRARVAEVRGAVEAHAGLHACGAWLAGTGLASVVADARRTARGVLAGISE